MALSPSVLKLKVSLHSADSYKGIYGSISDVKTTHILIGFYNLLVERINCEDEQIDALLCYMKPKSDKKTDKSSVESIILSKSLEKLTVISLATKVSRHNCSIRPDEIYAQLMKCKPSISSTENESKLEISIFCRNRQEALASSVACSRAFPAYNRKSNYANQDLRKDLWHANNIHIQIYLEEHLDESSLETLSNRLSQISDSTRRAAYLVDAPTNELNTTVMVQEAEEVVKRLDNPNTSIKILDYEYLKSNSFGGLVSVGRAAEHKPKLVILSYKTNSLKTITWVGKGIVYDTGGLSIKTKTGMPGMKRDMGGAAAILAAFEAAVQTNFPHNLHALLCLAENSVASNATRPDDVITLYSGKTIEINNTDAEGRLVLSDGVAYATKHLNPDVLLDMATLTGAQGVATGRHFAALYCNNENLEHNCIKAGRICGELCHAMPYCPEFFTFEFNSAVADLKNSVKDRSNAQASCAGQFISESLADDYEGEWIHVDMAYPVHAGERATGYGVSLLLTLFHDELLLT